MVRVGVPDADLLAALAPLPDGVDALVWDPARDDPPAEALDIVVLPYLRGTDDGLATAAPTARRLVQSQMLGYDGVADRLPPGVTFANARGVHEASTAELAVGLILASLRRLPALLNGAGPAAPAYPAGRSLADRRVLVLGQGGVGVAIVDRLLPFEVDLVRLARSERRDDRGAVHGMAELPSLLPTADVVVLAVPLDDTTRHLVDADFLSRLRRGALLVNVSRGAVVDTAALAAAARDGLVDAALDVTDPEPLPAGHELLGLPNVLITPHIGGNSSAMLPRIARLVRTQAERIRDGLEPVNVVLRT